MEIIQNKSNGPIAQLKHRFRKQLIVLPLVIALVTLNLSRHHDLFSDALFWFFVVIGLVMCGYFLFSYRLVSHIASMEGMVKTNLKKQVTTLERGYRVRMLVLRILPILFLALLELLLFLNQEPSLARWHAQPLGIRLLCYAAVWSAFFLLTKYVLRHKYGRHIQHLKELVAQMQ
ncbi:hypothetical protein [Pontibacter chitinilyticus]|uniref:hypothetical protein n=1 Tax=Pontibacter chitinilyticus TaxID=2674989 RepID=UPI0032195BAB